MKTSAAGPWRAEPEILGAAFSNTLILAGSGPAEVVGVVFGGESSREIAQLFAAGREMQAALRAAYSDIQRLPGHTVDMLGRIEAALAKAEGRTP